ncbi:unnamed protein product [Effrenium voratum]|nr:unnamed protein product [Effrenium voratum]
MAGARDVGGNMLAAAAAGCIQPALFNPMDCLRIRWQVSGSGSSGSSGSSTSFRKFTEDLIRREGLWRGLWRPGLPTNMCAVAVSQGLRLGLYPTTRDALQLLGPSSEKSAPAMLGAGLAAGSLAYFVGAPFWLVKTRLQAAAQFAADGLAGKDIYPARFGPDYWQGCSPLIVRGALLTAGHMFGYDGTKTTARRLGVEDGPLVHVAAATVAGFCAASFSAPADALMTQYQSSDSPGLVTCAGQMLRSRGPSAFFRGWTANFLRLAPTFTVGSLIYEQCRLCLGLGYMRPFARSGGTGEEKSIEVRQVITISGGKQILQKVLFGSIEQPMRRMRRLARLVALRRIKKGLGLQHTRVVRCRRALRPSLARALGDQLSQLPLQPYTNGPEDWDGQRPVHCTKYLQTEGLFWRRFPRLHRRLLRLAARVDRLQGPTASSV